MFRKLRKVLMAIANGQTEEHLMTVDVVVRQDY